MDVNEEARVHEPEDEPRPGTGRWKKWVAGAVAAVILAGTAGGGVYASLRRSALEHFDDAQQGAVRACSEVPTVDPELLEAGKVFTDVSELEALVKDASPIVADEPPEGLSALRTATADLKGRQKTCEDTAPRITAAKEELEGAVAEDLQAKLEVEAVDALKIQEAAAQLDREVAGKIDPDPKAPGTALRTNLVNALGELLGALPVGSMENLPWRQIADQRVKLADATAKVEEAMKAVSDAYADWQAQQVQTPVATDEAVAVAPALASNESSGFSDGSSYSSDSWSGSASTASGSSSSSGEGASSEGGQDLGVSGYWHNHNQPEYVYDADGHQHHQIQPDANGSWTDDLGEF